MVCVIYPIHKNTPISKPGFRYSFSGMPPVIRKSIAAKRYLKKTMFTGVRSDIKSFTTANVEPKSKADVTRAIIARLLSFKII